MHITEIDPIKYNLIFERFLNPERVSMPDIDVDFCIEHRQDVIDYVVRKYGKDKVSQIITFGTLKAKAAVRDVARVLDASYADGDAIAKAIPNELGMTISKALEINHSLGRGTIRSLWFGISWTCPWRWKVCRDMRPPMRRAW